MKAGSVAGRSLAVVVLSTLAGRPDDGPETLADLLGPIAAAALSRELLRGARTWAAAAAGPEGPGAFEANSADAALAALGDHAGPVAFVAPDVPFLDDALAVALIGDLDDGVSVTFGPTYDASPFLLATPTVDPDLLRLAGGHRDELFGAMVKRGEPIGMLRSERRLATVADARAAAADPRTPLELGVLLAAGLTVRARER